LLRGPHPGELAQVRAHLTHPAGEGPGGLKQGSVFQVVEYLLPVGQDAGMADRLSEQARHHLAFGSLGRDRLDDLVQAQVG
jgi:hypothetical protein